MNRKKFNIKNFQINNIRKREDNTLLSLSLLIGIILLSNYITHQINRLRSPTVAPNETGMSITQLYITEPNTQN